MSAGVPDNEATTIAASAIADMSKRSQAARTAQDFNLGNLAGGSAKRQRVIPPGPISLHSVDTNAHMDIMASNANQMMNAMTRLHDVFYCYFFAFFYFSFVFVM